MRTLKIILALVALVLVALPLAALVRDPAESRPVRIAVDPVDGPLVGLLPDATLAAVEIRDLARRWDEVRGIPAVARFQERVLEGTGLAVGDLPRLVGNDAVVALLPAPDRDSVIPFALLRPADPSAEALLRDACRVRDEGSRCVAHWERGALWVFPSEATERVLERIRSDPRKRTAVSGEALPDGGLVRGWLDPVKVRDFLRDRIPGDLISPMEILFSLAAAELEFVRSAGFRRDLTAEGIVTDAVIAYDTGAMPPEVSRVFRSPATARVHPSPLPPDTILVSSFRPEADAVLAWLRHVSADDPRGPLRNLEFWIEQFEERSGRDLERDLVAPLGERGWFVLTEGDGSDHVRFFVILEAEDASRVEATLLDLRSWAIGQIRGHSLGLARLRPRDERIGDRTAHELVLWTPIEDLPGPAFVVTEDHLVLGSGTDSLATGLRLLATKESWRVPDERTELSAPAHETVALFGPALARVVEAWPGTSGRFATSLAGILGEVRSGSATCRYESDAVRVRGLVRFND